MTKKADLAIELVKKARVLAKRKKYDESLNNYVRAIRMKPKDYMREKGESWYGWVHEAANLALAQDRIDRAIEIYEVDSVYASDLEKAVYKAHKKGMIDIVNTTIERWDRKEWFGNISDLYKKMKKYNEAIEYREKEFDKFSKRELRKNEDAVSSEQIKVHILEKAIKLAESNNLDERLANLYRKLFLILDKGAKVTDVEINEDIKSRHLSPEDEDLYYYWAVKDRKIVRKQAVELAKKLGIEVDY